MSLVMQDLFSSISLQSTGFLQSVPRPPVPGEETEPGAAESSCAHSTRSAPAAPIAHTYLRSLAQRNKTSATLMNHRSTSISPAATPRKSNLDRTLLASCDEPGAPLGFEPEGSVSGSPGLFAETTTGTPRRCLRWAESLEALLEDKEGVKLYRTFLDQELESCELLDFWFACSGLKLMDAGDCKSIISLVKLIHKMYIRREVLRLSAEVKRVLLERLKRRQIDQNIFDLAKEEVEESMRQESYPLFLKSDLYLEYLRQGGGSNSSGGCGGTLGESPRTSNNSSGSDSVKPFMGLLPTLHEERELSDKDAQAQDRSLSECLMNCSLTGSLTNKPYEEQSSKERGNYSNYRQERRPAESLSQFRVPHPYHVSYAPVSVQDSDIQSASSDTHTDDANSNTDSSRDGHDRHHRVRRRGGVDNNSSSSSSKVMKRQTKIAQKYAAANQQSTANIDHPFIPRTERLPRDQSLAEKDPERFASLIIDRLQKVKDELEKLERVKKTVQRIETIDQMEQVSYQHKNAEVKRFDVPSGVSISQKLGSSTSSLPVERISRTLNPIFNEDPDILGNHIARTLDNEDEGDFARSISLENQTKSLPQDCDKDNAQSILEQHVSRVFENESSFMSCPYDEESFYINNSFVVPNNHLHTSFNSFNYGPDYLGYHKTGPGYYPDESYISYQSLAGPYGMASVPSANSSAVLLPFTSASSSSLFDPSKMPHISGHDMQRFASGAHSSSASTFDSGVVNDEVRQKRSSVSKETSEYRHGGTSQPLADESDTLMSRFSEFINSRYAAEGARRADDDFIERKNLNQRHQSKRQFRYLQGCGFGPLESTPRNKVVGREASMQGRQGSWGSRNFPGRNYQEEWDFGGRIPQHHNQDYQNYSVIDLSRANSSLSLGPRSVTESRFRAPQFYRDNVDPSFQYELQHAVNRDRIGPVHSSSSEDHISDRLSSIHGSQDSQGSSQESRSHNKHFNVPDSSQQQQQRRVNMTSNDSTLNQSHSRYALQSANSSHISSSANIMTSNMNSSQNLQMLESRRSQNPPVGGHGSDDVTVVGYKFCDEEIPYRTTVCGTTITLGQFKQLITRRGNFRYFFKKACDEFESGVVQEEVFCDGDVVPLYEGKIFCKIEKRQ